MTGVSPVRLLNPIRSHAWGSPTALSELLGTPSSGAPQAELWLGDHPRAPSRLGDGTPLSEWIAAAPEQVLGPEVARRHATLPFLLKVLAVARPLSVQLHPDDAQARAGFAVEEARGLPPTDPRRVFPDPRGKPELLVALSPFEALCGLRDPDDLADLLGVLGVWPDLRRAPERALRTVLTEPLARRAARAEALAEALDHGGRPADRARLRRLRDAFPGDPGLACAALLRPVFLAPGEALQVPPGTLHTYLGGVGVEIQAASDCVVRAGCTPKPTDPHLAWTLAGPGGGRRPVPLVEGPETRWETPDLPFALSRIDLRPATATRWTSPALASAEIALCTHGAVRLRAGRGAVPLVRGESAVVPAAAGHWALEGAGTVFRASGT